LRRHRRQVTEPGPAAARIERLLAVQGEWLRGRVRSTASYFRLDPDELCQELMLSMLRRSTTLDEGNRGVRTWLGSRVDWTAKDMLRRRGREETVGPHDLEAIEREMALRHPAPEQPGPVTLDVKHLVELGLTAHEAQVVALRCTGVDMPLKDFAELVRRSHASVRKEYERGTRKIEELFGLTPEEVVVVRAWRRHGTAAATAPHVNRSGDEVLQILEDAHKKIDRIFDETEGRP
jgi:DNA-directed RNA polymerase specialized sigma24 family protein